MSARRPEGKLAGARAKHESVVKRLFCSSCGSMQDARRVGRSPDYTLACGCTRTLMSSEQVQERNDAQTK
jgi:hypothetical protein